MSVNLQTALLTSLLLLSQVIFAQPRSSTHKVTLDFVAKKAQERASSPFHSPKEDMPMILRADKLNYDSYREIEFRHDKALWFKEELPFRVEFFHPGYLYQEPVKIFDVTSTHVQPIRFLFRIFSITGI